MERWDVTVGDDRKPEIKRWVYLDEGVPKEKIYEKLQDKGFERSTVREFFLLPYPP